MVRACRAFAEITNSSYLDSTRVEYVVAEEDDETIDSLEEALSRALTSSEASVKEMSFFDGIALDNGVRNIQKKPTPRPPPLSTIGGVCTDLASKATLGKRTGETMRAEERPPKKAALTSLDRSSGTGQANINSAASDLRLGDERMREPAGVEAKKQGVKEPREEGYGGKSNEGARPVSFSARDGGVCMKPKTTKEKHEAMAKSLEDEADELEAKTAALRRCAMELRRL